MIRFSAKYEPLWSPKTRYIVVTGGRASGKSFALASAILDHTYNDPYSILYSRWNLTSAEVSIIPEFQEKMDVLDCAPAFHVRQRDVENVATGGRIWFRGMQQSSKNQIAKLKSINKLKIFVLDEAQELMSESMFDTVDDSIREKDTDNFVIISLNPTDISHWIYRRFFAEPGVPYDFNGVKGNVTYIHTTYLDNLKHLSQSFLDKVDALKQRNYDKYENIYLGKWSIRKEGLIYPNWEPATDAEYPKGLPQWYANDWGFAGDPNALVRMCYEPVTGTIWVKQLMYKTGVQPREVARLISNDARRLILRTDADGLPVYYSEGDCIVYCDPARPEHIRELRTSHGLNALPANNKDKAGRIGWLQGFRVKYIGDAIANEVGTYSWLPSPTDESQFTDKPQDGNDHLMDAINYGAVTHLRRMGIVPQ